MSEKTEHVVSSYKCPSCHQFTQYDMYRLDYIRYLSQDIRELYQKKKLKKLTFYHTYDGTEDIWCEIDLLSENENFSVYLQGNHFYNFIPDNRLGTLESPLEEKTKVYSAYMLHREISNLLGDLFDAFDIRLLNNQALDTHPKYNMHHGYYEYSTITLELVDGRTDEITYRQTSVGSNIVSMCVFRNPLLKEWFGYY